MAWLCAWEIGHANLIGYFEEVTKNVVESKAIDVMKMDFNKAFDNVLHSMQKADSYLLGLMQDLNPESTALWPLQILPDMLSSSSSLFVIPYVIFALSHFFS